MSENLLRSENGIHNELKNITEIQNRINKKMKNKKHIVIIIGSILSCCILLFGIRCNKNLMKIKADWENVFSERKLFFKSCDFSGKVINKDFMEKANQPYSLTILLDANTSIPQWGDQFYPDYYEYDSSKRTLMFSIPKYIYNNVDINSIIKKNRGSDFICVNGKLYKLLSNKSLEWTP